MSGINTALNIFLAILENRPESARAMMSPGFLGTVGNVAQITGRIEQARENIKCQAVKEAIRLVFRRTLELQPGERSVPEALAQIEEARQEAYLEGVTAVEEILTQVLKTCTDTEKKLGPEVAF